MQPLTEKIVKWSATDDGSDFIGINAYIRYLSKHLFFDYEPTSGPFPEFDARLDKWLNNIDSEEDQKLLVRLIPNLFYVGREELNSLYKTAFESVIVNWLFSQNVSTIDKDDFEQELSDAVKTTWFCPITDSFRISQFYHVNNLDVTHEFRPDWRSLKKFGSDEKIRQYIQANGVKQIVLLEDFIGTGSQTVKSVEYCVNTFGLKVLVVPLLICEPGLKALTDINNGNLFVRAVIHIDKGQLVNSGGHTDVSLQKFVALSAKLYDTVMGTNDRSKIKTFGYADTGSLAVMYSNTPNNSLPLIHVKSNTWAPLFKRHSRS